MELKKITEKPILETATDDTHVLVCDAEGVKRMPASAVGGGFKDVVVERIDSENRIHTITLDGVTYTQIELDGFYKFSEADTKTILDYVTKNPVRFIYDNTEDYGEENIEYCCGFHINRDSIWLDCGLELYGNGYYENG